jgi:nickel-dependent lactate racemase
MMSHSLDFQASAWYGDQTITLLFPDEWELNVAGDQNLPALTLEDVISRFHSPVASPNLSELATGHHRAAILIDDLTRPTPTADILPIVLDELNRGGVRSDNITIIVAGGSHAPESDQAIRKKVGDSLPGGVRVIAHDSRAEMAYLGRTEIGTPIYINPVILDCDLKIGIGCIYPHPAAGFSGGAKILVPGSAGIETIRYLHDHLYGAGRRGGVMENEFRQEIDRMASKIGLDFIVNMTLNQQRRISGIFSGDRSQAFERGVEFARKMYTVELLEDVDLTIADMYPFDVNLQFAYDRGLWPLEYARRGTVKVVLASCPGGIGSHELFPLQNSFWTRLKRRLKHFQMRDLKTITQRLKAAQKLIERKSLSLVLVSNGLEQVEVKSIFPSSRVYKDWTSALDGLEDQLPCRRVKVAVYRCAPLMLPRLSQLDPV